MESLEEPAMIAGALALLIGIVGFGWMRRQYTVVAAINAAVAIGIMLASARHLDAAIRYNETPMLALFAFEAIVVISFALMMFGLRVPNFLTGLQAVINFILLALLAVFTFSVKFNGLF